MSNIFLTQPYAITPAAAMQYLPIAKSILRGDERSIKKLANTNPLQVQIAHEAAAGNTVVTRFYQQAATSMDNIPENSVAILPIQGPITKYGDACSYGTQDYENTLRMLGANSNVSGVILQIDSPGGMVSGTEMFAKSVRAFTDTYKKPIVALADGMMASAAYWIGSQANEIWLLGETSSVGSIGTMTTILDFRQSFENDGIKLQEVYASASSNKNDVYRQAIDGNIAPLVAELDKLNNVFLDAVKSTRNTAFENVKQMPVVDDYIEPLTGKMYIGKEAIKVGLADKVVNDMQNAYNTMQARIRAMKKAADDQKATQPNNASSGWAIDKVLKK